MFNFISGQFLIVSLVCLVEPAKLAPVTPVVEVDQTTLAGQSAIEFVAYSTQSPSDVEAGPATTVGQSNYESDWQFVTYTTPNQQDVGTASRRPNRYQNQPDRSRWNPANYVLSEIEYQQLLARLQREAEESVIGNPGNYVDRDVSLEEIISLIEISEAINQTDAPGTNIPTFSDLERSSTNRVYTESSETTSVSTGPQASIQLTKECSICLETIESNDHIIELKCDHEFHHSCIVYWGVYSGRSDPRCPICRGNLVLKNDRPLPAISGILCAT